MYGFDVYTTEVDYQGIDFIIKGTDNEYYDVQVKSVLRSNYIYMNKKKFDLRKNLLLVLIVHEENQAPNIYLIPSLEWEKPTALLVDRNYEGKKSAPEWGISLSKKNNTLLQKFDFDTMVKSL